MVQAKSIVPTRLHAAQELETARGKAFAGEQESGKRVQGSGFRV